MLKVTTMLWGLIYGLVVLNIFGTAFMICRVTPSMVASASGLATTVPSTSTTSITSKSITVNQPIDKLISHNHLKGLASIPLPESRKRFLNKISFGWAKSILDYGKESKSQIDFNDLWILDDHRLMSNVSETFEYYFNQELTNSSLYYNNTSKFKLGILQEFWSYPLTRAIIKMYKRDFIRSGIYKFFSTFVQFFPSILISRILRIASRSSNHLSSNFYQDGFITAILLYLSLNIKTIVENLYFDSVITMGSSIKGALSAAIYRKSLKLSPSGRQNFTTGEIVNYMQLDTSRIENLASSLHVVWDGIFQIVGYTILLLHFLGPSVFAGIATMILLLPINSYFLKRLSGFKTENLKYTDLRVKLTNEILQGIRAIKSYNWETPFITKLSNIRDKELHALKSSANSRAILVSILSAAPALVAVVTLAVYTLFNNVLSPVKVFTSLALFNQLRFPITFFSLLLNKLSDGLLSLIRISKFLLSQEIIPYVVNVKDKPNDSNNYNISSNEAIRISNGNFSWSSNTTSNRGLLSNMNVSIKQGELIAIVGPVGSGKSTLLSALLGELFIQSGEVIINGSISYIPQNAWIPNDSLRNVILFGNKFNETLYNQTITSCCLDKDLDNLDSGDNTEIGERGVNLSGGQKQRVSIARGVYNNNDIYLFDDPLSALDSEISLQLFDKCLINQLRSKTRLLVTHQLSVLSKVDRIIVMNMTSDGQCGVIDMGTLKELSTRGYDLSKLVKPQNETITNQSVDENFESTNITSFISTHKDIESINSEISISEEALLVKHDLEEAIVNSIQPTGGFIDACITSSLDNDDCIIDSDMKHLNISNSEVIDPFVVGNTVDSTIQSANIIESNTITKSVKKLMTVEERKEGAVSWPTYKYYLDSAKNPLLLSTILLSFILANAATIGQQWVVGEWTSDIGYIKYPLPVYLLGVTVMAIGVAVFNWSRTYIGCILGAQASRSLHNRMTKRVLRAPLSFFDSTPIGRLIQRFSKDLDQVDQELPNSFGQLMACVLNMIAAMIAVTMVTPSFAFVMIPVFLVYISITNYYRKVARDLKRLESISRSPIYAHFSETLGGLSVIRAFIREKLYQRLNEVKLDDNISSIFTLKIIDRWLSVRLEFLGNFIVFMSSLLVLLSGSKASPAGISLNNALSITGLLNWAVRNGAETESLMNSVERVLYTTTETPNEKPFYSNEPIVNNQSQLLFSSDNELVSSGWPRKGGIVFNQVKMRYRNDFEPVLRNVTINIVPGERVGIVGRTGSGKSSLFRCLLRLNEIESGDITIDGINISTIGLDALRSSISIIPQDPVLFSGSIRLNIDPFNRCSDDALWIALRKSNLDQTVRMLPGQLDFEVSEGGENFSAGQRQLLCLARALIRKSKILLLDEATSSVDFNTDILIQNTIHEEFMNENCTILIIAHRLDTIMNANKIIVMESGNVKEYDKPSNLLKNGNSLFSQLVYAELLSKQSQSSSSNDISQNSRTVSLDELIGNNTTSDRNISNSNIISNNINV